MPAPNNMSQSADKRYPLVHPTTDKKDHESEHDACGDNIGGPKHFTCESKLSQSNSLDD